MSNPGNEFFVLHKVDNALHPDWIGVKMGSDELNPEIMKGEWMACEPISPDPGQMGIFFLGKRAVCGGYVMNDYPRDFGEYARGVIVKMTTLNPMRSLSYDAAQFDIFYRVSGVIISSGELRPINRYEGVLRRLAMN
jgi:hypothetical protein